MIYLKRICRLQMDNSRNFSQSGCLIGTHIKKQNMNTTPEFPFPTSSHYPLPKKTTVMISDTTYMLTYIMLFLNIINRIMQFFRVCLL